MDDDWALVNGVRVPLPADGRPLVRWLREDLGLTGTKFGCGQGHCGACTVLVDGQPLLACCALATTLRGAEILTVEGLADKAPPDPLIGAFAQHGAFQCGFCTPGMIIAARALLNANAGNPIDVAVVRRSLAGNLCRCTGYAAIVAAVLATGGAGDSTSLAADEERAGDGRA